MSAEALEQYLNVCGILSCNVNPYLPSLGDVGCTWADAVALIDAHKLFFCKSWRRRTVYLSPEVYHLLKAFKTQRPMPEDSAVLFALLEQEPGMESGDLRVRSLLGQTAFVKALDFLLEERYVTAIANGTWLNPNWSTYRYGTAGAWEACAAAPQECPEPETRLRTILGRTMPEDELEKLLR